MLEKTTIGVIMDPINRIDPKKDTTLALLLEAQSRGASLYYMELKSLSLQKGAPLGNCQPLRVFSDEKHWYALEAPIQMPLDHFDILWMRKDPPVDMQYIYSTYILERAEQKGVLVINKPQSLRDMNEKVFATLFPQCIPPTLVSSDKKDLLQFIKEQKIAVLKPLDGMGGKNILKCEIGDPNLSVIIDLLTHKGSEYIMAQAFIPEIMEQGDKRILLLDGKPLPYALARIPSEGDFRGNLAAGAKGVGCPLNDRDRWICAEIGPTLREKGLVFVGIDVIGSYLTEINITSPTCVRELESAFNVNISSDIVDCILSKQQKLKTKKGVKD